MATYSYHGPSADSDTDSIRFLLGDTGPEWLLSDEEILYATEKWKPEYGTVEYVASTLAENIAAKYAREASLSADGVSVGLGQVAQQFRDLAVNLRQQHQSLLVGGFPDVGGITPGEDQLPGIAPFSFGTGIHDLPEAGQQDFGGATNIPAIEDLPGQ